MDFDCRRNRSLDNGWVAIPNPSGLFHKAQPRRFHGGHREQGLGRDEQEPEIDITNQPARIGIPLAVPDPSDLPLIHIEIVWDAVQLSLTEAWKLVSRMQKASSTNEEYFLEYFRTSAHQERRVDWQIPLDDN